MTAYSRIPSTARVPLWMTAAGGGGVAWNIFGVFKFLLSVNSTDASLIASGLSPEQAAAMTGYPAWMTAAFALGVFSGLAGSVLLLLRRAAAQWVLLTSLVAYVALWIGDAAHGIFAALGAAQVIILTAVVAIAGVLWGLSRHRAAKA